MKHTAARPAKPTGTKTKGYSARLFGCAVGLFRLGPERFLQLHTSDAIGIGPHQHLHHEESQRDYAAGASRQPRKTETQGFGVTTKITVPLARSPR